MLAFALLAIVGVAAIAWGYWTAAVLPARRRRKEQEVDELLAAIDRLGPGSIINGDGSIPKLPQLPSPPKLQPFHLPIPQLPSLPSFQLPDINELIARAMEERHNSSVQNIRAFKASSHISTGQLVAINNDGTVSAGGGPLTAGRTSIGVAMGTAAPTEIVPVDLQGGSVRRSLHAFGPIKTGEPVCSVRENWVTAASRHNFSRQEVVGIAENDAVDGAPVVVTIFTSTGAGSARNMPAFDETAKSEIAHAFWKRALAPDYLASQRDLVPQLVEAMQRSEVDLEEGAAILSRYGYDAHKIALGQDSEVKSARYVLDALVITTTRGTQVRVDRDLALLRAGGVDSPMRQLIEGRAGSLTDSADAAFDEAEELLR